MDKVVIRPTAKTPAIDFDPESGVLSIQGKSSPEDSRSFYKPLIEWCEEYAVQATGKTTVDVFLEHFDTSSSKGILDLIKRLQVIKDQDKEVEIVWHYESDDSDILEAGECFRHITKLPFRMTPH